MSYFGKPAHNSAAEEVTTKLRHNFERFAEDRAPEGTVNPHQYKVITLDQSNRWMKEAHVLRSGGLSTKDTSKAFDRMHADAINFDQYVPFLAIVAKSRGADLNEIIERMAHSEEDAVSRLQRTTKRKGVVIPTRKRPLTRPEVFKIRVIK